MIVAGGGPASIGAALAAAIQGALFPYRSLLPRSPQEGGVEGLLVAGRCSSATKLGHYGGKSIGNMISVGQAAGVAGALCAQFATGASKDYTLGNVHGQPYKH